MGKLMGVGCMMKNVKRDVRLIDGMRVCWDGLAWKEGH